MTLPGSEESRSNQITLPGSRTPVGRVAMGGRSTFTGPPSGGRDLGEGRGGEQRGDGGGQH